MGNNPVEKIFFVPLYDYLSLPDFKKILDELDSSALKDSYAIKLVDLQTDPNIIEANDSFNINGLAYLMERAPLTLNQKRNSNPNKTPLYRQQWFHRLQKIKSYKNAAKNKSKTFNAVIVYCLKYTARAVHHFLAIFFMILFFWTRVAAKIKNRIHEMLLPLLCVNGYYSLFHEIYDFFKQQKPACLVVSSDLANVNIRLAIASARLLHIPVIIFWMGDIEKKKGSPLREAINKLLIRTEHWFPYQMSYFRAVIFDEVFLNIFGYYAYDATIFVSNTIAKKKLLDGGISNKKIKIVTFKKTPTSGQADLNGLERKKFIVFYTENLTSIYGEKYSIDLHRFLGKLFSQLHKDYGMQFVVRPHPRERSGKLYTTLIQECFSEEGILIDKGLPIDYLIENSLLNIAHFSKVLLDALLGGEQILSINILKDNRTFIPKGEYDLLESQSFDEISETLHKFLSDSGFCSTYEDEHKKLRKWLLTGAEPFEDAFQEVVNTKVA